MFPETLLDLSRKYTVYLWQCRKLNTAEQKYSSFDRELLSVYAAIRHFRWTLEGRHFYVLSDHKPLTFALMLV